MIDEQKDKIIKNQSSAKIKYIRLSPLKVQRILTQIRGKAYIEAIMILEFMPYKPCIILKKMLKSAANNAISSYGCKKESLIISEAFANKGPVLKRFQPRAQGRAFKIQKPTCHITIKVTVKN